MLAGIYWCEGRGTHAVNGHDDGAIHGVQHDRSVVHGSRGDVLRESGVGGVVHDECFVCGVDLLFVVA